MFKIQKLTLLVMSVAVLFLLASFVGNAAPQKATPKPVDKAALTEEEVKNLILMMDTDRNGKISKAEFMNFMSTEFDRLDKDKSGELDVKELAQSAFRPSHPPVGK